MNPDSYDFAGVEFTGDWPIGDATATLEVSAPELAADVLVPVIVHTHVSVVWLFLVAFVGALTGVALRNRAHGAGTTRAKQSLRGKKALMQSAGRALASILTFEVVAYFLYGDAWKGSPHDVALIFLWALSFDLTADAAISLARGQSTGPPQPVH